ncbi:unnamed protein product [Prorocentrum cordatum]|uniref:Uncharacterized protein n=1 Tax=Prorocentrum cordatum TaxID=2364126 RepID=A0ABN9WMZ4_9DINO|nr:unnamed protein product [Polarella glacialis]
MCTGRNHAGTKRRLAIGRRISRTASQPARRRRGGDGQALGGGPEPPANARGGDEAATGGHMARTRNRMSLCQSASMNVSVQALFAVCMVCTCFLRLFFRSPAVEANRYVAAKQNMRCSALCGAGAAASPFVPHYDSQYEPTRSSLRRRFDDLLFLWVQEPADSDKLRVALMETLKLGLDREYIRIPVL